MADNEKRKTAPRRSSRRAALQMVGLAAATAFLAKSRVAAAAAESTPAKASTVKASTTPAKASTVKASTAPAKASTVKASTTPAKASTVKASTAQRLDPYKNFKFRVQWNGRTVAGVNKVRGLSRATESTGRKLPGRTRYEAITLERGVTHDQEFEKWANRGSFKGRRKDIVIERYNEAGRRVETFKIFRCWVSEYQALPDLDANANAISFRRLKLENEGWERD